MLATVCRFRHYHLLLVCFVGIVTRLYQSDAARFCRRWLSVIRADSAVVDTLKDRIVAVPFWALILRLPP